MDDGRSMRAVESAPTASLNVRVSEELIPDRAWPVSPPPFHRSRPLKVGMISLRERGILQREKLY